MIIAVLAFRKPSTSDPSSVIQPETELQENLVHSSTAVAIQDTEPREEIDIDRPPSRRSRGMTIAQVLPLLISSVPVRAGVTMPSIEPSANRRHSLNIRPRNYTVCTEPSTRQITTFVPTTDFRRKRAKTIAVPPSTTQKWSGSLERIRQPIRSPPLAPIASAEESNDEEHHSSSSLSSSQLPSLPSVRLPPVDQMDLLDEPISEKHWLLNYRFLLFCFSNFALCLVMGAPYVIFPKYISETFQNQGYLASWTLSNMGIASGVGQILLGYLHDRKIFSAWIMYTFSVIISGASLVILALFRYKAVVLICAFMYGLAISANYALQVLIVIDAISMEKMTDGFGILQFCQGVSTLIGIPIQGKSRLISSETNKDTLFLLRRFIT